jgi:glutamate-1-semialdehyde aminotransferase
VTGGASAFAVHFRRSAPRNAREAAEADTARARAYCAFMLAHGIAFLTPTMPHMLISTAHGEREVDEFIAASEAFAAATTGVGTN